MNRAVVIPDIGDAEDVEVIEICVAVGDEVAENDALIVIESDKASMEVPAPFAGTVSEVHVTLSDQVNAGDAILDLHAVADEIKHVKTVVAVADQVNVGDEIKDMKTVATTADRLSVRDEIKDMKTIAEATDGAPQAHASVPSDRVYAGPAVRRLARELGVDLAAVAGTGNGGRIVRDDVKAFVKQTLAAPSAPGLAPVQEIDFARFGDIEVKPLTRIRARGAAALHSSWQHVVHVTQHDEADVTDLEEFRASLRDEAAQHGVKLTPLPFLIKACVHALRAHPQFNASLDAGVTALIHKRYYHIGIAVDTEDGLVVPVVRDADRKGLFELAAETARLAAAAREKKLTPADLQGGSFTISSLGAIGGTGFTPIVNAPEVAILGVARLATKPMWDGHAFQPRQMLPLSLSYDHRAVNGAEGGRFVADLVAILSDIRRLAL